MDYITIENFADIYKVKSETVKKNMEKIPGVEYVDLNYRVIVGTRYPLNFRTKISNNYIRIFLILEALDKNRYIDEKKLKFSSNDFQYLLSILVNEGYIIKNDSQNTYGTNGFNITLSGMQYKSMRREKAVKLLAETFGTFLGAAASQLIQK